jgi:hypothetical protein
VSFVIIRGSALLASGAVVYSSLAELRTAGDDRSHAH